MPLDIQIIRASEFVRVGPKELLDFKASKEALTQLACACRKRGIDRAILDLRELPIPPRPIFTPTELSLLVETFREAGFTRRQKLAILYRSDPHHGARMFAFISMLRGWQVRAFPEFEGALLWLSAERPQRRSPGEHEIPVTIVKKIEVK